MFHPQGGLSAWPCLCLGIPLRSYRLALLIGSAVLALQGGIPSAARAQTLERAVADALNFHPAVAAAQAGRDLAEAERSEKRSAYFPEVSVNAATGRVYGDNSTSRGLTVDRGAGYSWNHEAGITVRQMIFDGMQTPNRVAAAATRLEGAELDIIDIRENLALRAVEVYFEVLRNREAKILLADHAARVREYRRRIEAMVEQGAADESQAIQALDIQNQLDGTLADIDGQLRKAEADYIAVVGTAPDPMMARPASIFEAVPKDVAEAVAFAKANHPAVIAAALQGEASAYEARAEKGALYPSIGAEISAYKKDVADIIGGEVVDERALLRMNWNFSTGGAQYARIRQHRERQAEAQAQAEELKRRIESEIVKSYAEMNAAAERLKIGQERVKVSGDLVAAYEKQFEVARVTLLNLLQVENAHFNAKLGVLNAEFRHIVAQYAVLANAGMLQTKLNVRPVVPAHEH
jgi:adhesin transport system outer membrane protein